MDHNSAKVKTSLLLVSSLTIASMITISASLPDMSAQFKDLPEGPSLVKLSLSLPALFIALTATLAGAFIDRAGRLKLLGAALVLYAVAGSSGFWLNNIYGILAGRALLGVSVGISMTIVTTLVADYYQGQARQQFAGLQIAVMSVAGILFITLGGFLADISWETPFLLYLFALAILPFALRFLPEPASAAVATDTTTKTGVKSPPMIWLVFINVMLMWVLFFILPIQIPFYLKDLGVEKNSLIGIAIAGSTLSSAISSFNYARLKGRFSHGVIFGLGYGLMALAFLVIALGHTYSLVVIGLVIAGLGMGLLIPNANILVMQLAPPSIRGREIGKLTTFWFLGQFIAPLVILPFINEYSQTSVFGGIAIITGILCIFFFLSHKYWSPQA
ncbi:MAG: MFS transporter [Robiginitalea sp.]|uniref:MFS transporter n=1 Tax=Robiginitalea sp. TaxID=1902411 RepID=UPI003C786E86